ncbi:hypothetical protein [Paramesorhizobium deserti]|nr:hypothetical protein [Paramesorhizobium deserti]
MKLSIHAFTLSGVITLITSVRARAIIGVAIILAITPLDFGISKHAHPA